MQTVTYLKCSYFSIRCLPCFARLCTCSEFLNLFKSDYIWTSI